MGWPKVDSSFPVCLLAKRVCRFCCSSSLWAPHKVQESAAIVRVSLRPHLCDRATTNNSLRAGKPAATLMTGAPIGVALVRPHLHASPRQEELRLIVVCTPIGR